MMGQQVLSVPPWTAQRLANVWNTLLYHARAPKRHMTMALASPLAAMRAPTALRARASSFVAAPSPRLARRNAPTRRARLAGAVAYTARALAQLRASLVL
jgi:hypothetical protein